MNRRAFLTTTAAAAIAYTLPVKAKELMPKPKRDISSGEAIVSVKYLLGTNHGHCRPSPAIRWPNLHAEIAMNCYAFYSKCYIGHYTSPFGNGEKIVLVGYKRENLPENPVHFYSYEHDSMIVNNPCHLVDVQTGKIGSRTSHHAFGLIVKLYRGWIEKHLHQEGNIDWRYSPEQIQTLIETHGRDSITYLCRDGSEALGLGAWKE